MTPEAQRIAIAEACGWTRHFQASTLPDYLHDLNAMHEAEKVLDEQQREVYWYTLERIVDPNDDNPNSSRWICAHATAAQRAEAFLRTIGKWDDNL